ncbi:uncharacterized protein si:ch211-196p9.1 [Danio aesculapii]|uniref:uncharacterized protein si:ch211-196p9.1 n=1 Tax=Danio aesculapii TaxID=1142201 RepID=UPI0024BF3367|nr:uncharacterized protein si:ch211-196p9.1 [Danio aesculapii]XP_056317152.1 uncharacterized protein si:ch211-196p9.1 [Danio aesculapii]
MLVKVKLGDAQKFFKITDQTLEEFLSAAFLKFGVKAVPGNVRVIDESGTEVDEDVFEEVVKDPSVGILTIKPIADLNAAPQQACPVPSNQPQSSSIDSTDSQETLITEDSSISKPKRLDDGDAKRLVELVLLQKPGGERIINEYNRTKTLGDATRRKMVNILAADMMEKNGCSRAPPKQVREKYAKGIVALFPCLSDPFSKNGYEHYYDSETGTGYLAWRIKTIQRGLAKERRASLEASVKQPRMIPCSQTNRSCGPVPFSEPDHQMGLNQLDLFTAQSSTDQQLTQGLNNQQLASFEEQALLALSTVRQQAEFTPETFLNEDVSKDDFWSNVQRVIVQTMLVKVKLGDAQKFVKITNLSMTEFLSAAFLKFGVQALPGNVRVIDESGTEVDEDVFEEVVKDPSVGVLTIKPIADLESVPPRPQACPVPSNQPQSSTIDSTESQETLTIEDSSVSKRMRLDDDAKMLVESVLLQKPGGERIINEYNRTKTLGDLTRRKMVNILAADMMKNGTAPPRQVREKYAKGIVALFPCLSDPFSKNGYEHYYDSESGTGYLAWRIKTIQRGLAKERRASLEASGKRSGEMDDLGNEIRLKRMKQLMAQTSTDLHLSQLASFEEQGPSAVSTVMLQSEFAPDTVLSEEECNIAILFMNNCPDEDEIYKKMTLTFDYRRKMVLDQTRLSDVLTVFTRFKDIKGLIEQDFVRMFGEGVSGRLLEKWTTAFKMKVIQQCKKLPNTSDVEELLLGAEFPAEISEDTADFFWDSDLSSILLLLHLIPPSAQGRKKPGKVSASQAERNLVVFKKTGTDIEDHLKDIGASSQPYLLAVGAHKSSVDQFFIILHQHAIPCKSTSSLGAFDELFKAHFVFGTSYNAMLHNMYIFIQTTVYNIDVGKVKESPRVAEVRARLLS